MHTSDLADVKKIDQATFSSEEQYDDAVYASMPGPALSVVAESPDGAIVGYAFVHPGENPHPNGDTFGYVRSVAVHPDHRRQGYAKALLEAVIEQADREVDLFVDERNEPAINLYKMFGFQPDGTCPTVPPRRRMVLVTPLP